ncbi:MAG: alpha/beta hydrolase [Pseudomonadota bacterium]
MLQKKLPLLQKKFDPLGPTVKQLTLESGRVVHYIDDGKTDGLPVVFTGGLGTSVRVIRLLDFLRSMRESMNIRIITVERNGFGATEFDPSLGMADFSSDVEAVLTHLQIDKFAVFGISGGGPYAAKIASRNAERLLSVHMAATSPSLGQPTRCADDSPASIFRDMFRHPQQYFGFNKESAVHHIVGFQDTAFDEAARAANMRGQQSDPAALDHEIALYCKEGAIDTSNVKAPVFVYMGLADPLITGIDAATWQQAFPNASVSVREYPGEGHDVQYRHLDQILLDIADYGDKILVCENSNSKLVAPDSVSEIVKQGGHLGICAWSN